MDFFKLLSSYSDYLHSIRKLEDHLSFDMSFPSKWGIPKSILEEGKIIPFETNNEDSKGFSFVCEINEKSVNQVIAKISKTVKLNLDRELKDKLFKETIEKLKMTFEKTDLEKLKTINFQFESQKNEVEDEQDGQESTTIELAE
jgi:hypothetical protein